MSVSAHPAPPFGRAILAIAMCAGLAWAGDAVAIIATLDGAGIIPIATVTAVIAATLTLSDVAIWHLSRTERESRPVRAFQSGIYRGMAVVRAMAPGVDARPAVELVDDMRPEPAIVTRAFDLGRRIGRRDMESSSPRS